MIYRAYDIDYDTDGEKVDGLPTEIELELGDDADPTLELGDAISNETGWCVNGYRFEVIGPSPATPKV